MFKSKTVTKFESFVKLFEWEIHNLGQCESMTESETMTAIGFDGIKYNGVFTLYGADEGRRSFDIDIYPEPINIQYFWEANGVCENGDSFPTNVTKIKLWVNVVAKVSTTTLVPALEYREPKKTTLQNLKEMWKNYSSSHFVIRCDNQDIIAIKPIMYACSVVFRKMFETDMKEKAQNRVVIDDFTPQVVQKMIEFCENETIEDIEECEEDLFKIAHKYEIESMKDFAITAMAKTANPKNIAARLELAQLYELEDFEKWCKSFVTA